jgi:hypothetical protein
MPDHHQLPGCVTDDGTRRLSEQERHKPHTYAAAVPALKLLYVIQYIAPLRIAHGTRLDWSIDMDLVSLLRPLQGMIACKLRDERQGRRTTTSAESNALFHAWIRLRDATIEHSACRRRRQQKNAGSRMRRSSSWPPAGTGGENTVT